VGANLPEHNESKPRLGHQLTIDKHYRKKPEVKNFVARGREVLIETRARKGSRVLQKVIPVAGVWVAGGAGTRARLLYIYTRTSACCCFKSLSRVLQAQKPLLYTYATRALVSLFWIGKERLLFRPFCRVFSFSGGNHA